MDDGFSDISCPQWDDLPMGIAALAEDLIARVATLQDASKRPWDHFRLEIWEDSGRIVAFPADLAEPCRVDVAGCQLTCAHLATREIW